MNDLNVMIEMTAEQAGYALAALETALRNNVDFRALQTHPGAIAACDTRIAGFAAARDAVVAATNVLVVPKRPNPFTFRRAV